MSTPKLPSMPELPGRKKKAGAKKGPAKKGRARKGPAKKGPAKKKRMGRKSRYEEEPEEFVNWGTAMSPAAYEAVVARPMLPARSASSYEEYETDDEEYEDDDDEGYMARHQEYTPADFTSVATPMNFSVLLLVVLFLLLILSRR